MRNDYRRGFHFVRLCVYRVIVFLVYRDLLDFLRRTLVTVDVALERGYVEMNARVVDVAFFKLFLLFFLTYVHVFAKLF